MPSVVWLPVICLASTVYLYLLSVNLPTLAGTSLHRPNTTVSFPTSLEGLRQLAGLLSLYRDAHIVYVVALFCSAYLYKQTFAIPGSVFMNLLAGALFGLSAGFPLVCLLTAIGATNCYLMSCFFGKSHVIRYFPQKIAFLNSKMEESSEGFFFFLLFLRLFPMSPNWLLNIVSPIINVPIHLFFLSVFIGLMPYNFLCVQTGCMLADLSTLGDVITWSSSLKLVAVATAALVPSLLFRHRNSYRQLAKKEL